MHVAANSEGHAANSEGHGTQWRVWDGVGLLMGERQGFKMKPKGYNEKKRKEKKRKEKKRIPSGVWARVRKASDIGADVNLKA